MINLRLEIEHIILASYLNQKMSNEFEQSLFENELMPYELFKASRTNKLCAKAIYVLQKDKKPICDITVLNFIENKTEVNQNEWINLMCKCDTSFNLMESYLQQLREIDEEDSKMDILKGLI